MKYLYLLLTSIFLLTFGPFNSAFSSSNVDWNAITFSFTSLTLCLLLFYNRKVSSEKMTLLTLCLVYAGIILVNSIFHDISLKNLPDTMSINLMRDKPAAWRNENQKFTILYLFFPLFLLIQYELLKRIELKVVIRCFASAITFSLIILFFQKYYDITFLNQPYWQELQRVGGLSTDPNAFAMTAFLLIPLIASGIFLEKAKILKICYMFIIVSLIAGVLFSGNRTVTAGILLLFLSLPVIFALAKKEMTVRTRLVLFISPFVLLLLVILLLPYLLNNSPSSLISIERSISTIEGFKEDGINSLLLNKERRVRNYLVAWDLLSNAPLAGWGPGGFYRESPNFLYLRSGYIFIVDSALNHYLMIGGDLGLPLLLLNLILVLSYLAIGLTIIGSLSDIGKRYVVSMLLITNILFLILINTVPPSYFPCLMWVWTAQLTCLAIFGEDHKLNYRLITVNARRAAYLVIGGIFFIVFIGSYQTTYGTKGYASRQNLQWWPYKYENNCYELETWGNAVARWCKDNAVLQFSIDKALPEYAEITLVAQHPDRAQRPVTVRYGGKSGAVHEVVFKDNPWITVKIPVSEEYIFNYTQPNGTRTRYFILSLDVSRTWIPKEWGVNNDPRELGVALIIPGFSNE